MKKFVSKVLAGALGLSMLCGVAAAEGETYVSWYTFADVYLSSVRTALDAAMEAKGLTVVDKDSNANQQTQTDDINTALVTGANAVVVNLVESGAIGTAETLMNAIKYGVECADEVLTAAGKPALEFYDAGNANKYLVDLNGTWSNTASFDYMQTILAQYNEANGNMVELVICNNDDMALGASNAGYNLAGGEGCTVIPVFGVDATDAAKELIANKQMTGSIKQDAEGMADAVATITANLIEGKDKFEGLNENYEVVDGWTVNIPYSVYTGE